MSNIYSHTGMESSWQTSYINYTFCVLMSYCAHVLHYAFIHLPVAFIQSSSTVRVVNFHNTEQPLTQRSLARQMIW